MVDILRRFSTVEVCLTASFGVVPVSQCAQPLLQLSYSLCRWCDELAQLLIQAGHCLSCQIGAATWNQLHGLSSPSLLPQHGAQRMTCCHQVPLHSARGRSLTSSKLVRRPSLLPPPAGIAGGSPVFPSSPRTHPLRLIRPWCRRGSRRCAARTRCQSGCRGLVRPWCRRGSRRCAARTRCRSGCRAPRPRAPPRRRRPRSRSCSSCRSARSCPRSCC